MATTKKAAESENLFESLTSFSPLNFQDNYEKVAEGLNAVAAFNKGSVDAFVASAGGIRFWRERSCFRAGNFYQESFEEGVSLQKQLQAQRQPAVFKKQFRSAQTISVRALRKTSLNSTKSPTCGSKRRKKQSRRFPITMANLLKKFRHSAHNG